MRHKILSVENKVVESVGSKALLWSMILMILVEGKTMG